MCSSNKIKIWLKIKIWFLLVISGAFFITGVYADDNDDIKLEADYILSCQYTSDASSDAYGAINNVYGKPTWVVPGENAVAIMGLLRASEVLGDDLYRQKANLAADYLLRMQASDGAWYDEYDYDKPDNHPDKSLRHTAEVMIAFDKLGYRPARYGAMKKAAEFLLSCQNSNNKKGNDDGLVGGGKYWSEENSSYKYHTWRWTSDNAYAYQALMAAARWAEIAGDTADARKYKTAANKIKSGLETVLLTSSGDHWVRVVDENDEVVGSEDRGDWISYAPAMLDVPVEGVNGNRVGQWIHNTLQINDSNSPYCGALVWDDTLYPDKKSPGYSFQAMLVWLDTGQNNYSQYALEWAVNSGLWQRTTDDNHIKGGWIDWVDDNGNTPLWWERFIDTSAYFIMVKTGGYDFSPIPEPSTLLIFSSGLFLFGFSIRKRNKD